MRHRAVAGRVPSRAPGHTDDGLIVWLPDEHLLVVGDYLSGLEIPVAYDSVAAYKTTLQTLSA